MPHIQRAFGLHLHISDLKERAAGTAAALDTLRTGIILVGANGKIALMNRAASAILAEHDGLLASLGGLKAQRSSESDKLQRLILEAVNHIGR